MIGVIGKLSVRHYSIIPTLGLQSKSLLPREGHVFRAKSRTKRRVFVLEDDAILCACFRIRDARLANDFDVPTVLSQADSRRQLGSELSYPASRIPHPFWLRLRRVRKKTLPSGFAYWAADREPLGEPPIECPAGSGRPAVRKSSVRSSCFRMRNSLKLSG